VLALALGLPPYAAEPARNPNSGLPEFGI